jgi:hypothetical protein
MENATFNNKTRRTIQKSTTKQQEPTNNQQNYKIKTITTLKNSNNQLTINKNNERSAPSEHDISTIP